MSEHNYKYTDDDLSLTGAHNYTLLLQVDSHSFSYAIIGEKKLMAWAENCPLGELQNPHELADILAANYKEVITGLHANGFTLLPQDVFEDGHIAGAARLLDTQAGEKIFSQNLDSNNNILYKVEEAVTNTLTGINTGHIVHSATGWIKANAGNYPTSTDIFVNIDNGTVELLNFSYNKLRFYNAFKYQNHEELAYYSILVAEELKVHPLDLTLVISGDINPSDKSYTYLAEFFGNVRLNDAKVLDLPAQIAPHKILSLAALSLCVSSEGN